MLTLGIDPAYQEGGAVLLASDGSALGAWHWKISKRKAGVIWYLKGRHGDGIIIRSLGDIGQCINRVTCGRDYLIVCEDLFGRGRTLQRLAESAGELLGAIKQHTPINVVRVGASTWRPAVLGCSARTSSDQAEAMAIKLAANRVANLGQLASNPHVAEAACIALWGMDRSHG
jgi:hypothetical protein